MPVNRCTLVAFCLSLAVPGCRQGEGAAVAQREQGAAVAQLKVLTDLDPAFAVAEPVALRIGASDAEGNPQEGASISAVLLFGADEEEGKDVVSTGEGEYTVEFTVPIAGPAMLYAWDEATGVAVEAAVAFAPGPPQFVAISVIPADSAAPVRAWELLATVEDRNGNVIPQESDLVWTATAGALEALGTTEEGASSASLQLTVAGPVSVTATTPDEALSGTVELQLPQLELTCPPAVHLTGDETEDRSIPVTLAGFAGEAAVAGYDLRLRINELTGFLETGSSQGLAPPTVEPLGDGEYRVFADPTLAEQPSEGVLSDLDFECLGEGDSEIALVDGTLFAADGEEPGAFTEIPIAYWQDASCPNKRIKDLCIQPILVTGPQGAGVDKAAITARLQREVALLQSNLDQACCKILVSLREVRELAPPASYVAEVAENTDGDKKRVVQVEWDARSVGSGLPRKIKLSTGTKDLMCAPNVRDEQCINVYFVKKGSAFGKFPNVADGPNVNRENARRTGFDKQEFGAADIKRSRLKPDGTGCEELEIFERKADGTAVPIPAATCKINGIVIPVDYVSDAAPAKAKPTFRHEVGHMLGLRHPWEYTDARLKKIRAQETKGRSLMGYREEAIFTATECEMIDAQNCNGFQRERGM